MNDKIILRIKGYRFFFFSMEGDEPPHIHIEHGNGIGVHWPKVDEDISVKKLMRGVD
jgi:hypothetical protein